MTNWRPSLEKRSGPRYRAIAEALAADVAAGTLKPGERMPTHRELAHLLDVTVGTVTRAYAEAERRGLVVGEVGRGTYVRGGAESSAAPRVRESLSPNMIDLSLNLPAPAGAERALADTMVTMAAEGGLAPLLEYGPEVGLQKHRAAGAAWIARAGVHAPPERVVVTDGAQHGMAAAMLSAARGGDLVLAEALTYPGMKELAHHLGLRLQGLAMDAEGVRPDAFEEACRHEAPRALYLMPNLQNPTAALMGEARRHEIVAIARRHGVLLVEDDVYGFLLGPDQPPPLAALAPDITYYVTSTSKCLTPGLRVGFVLAPEGLTERVGAAVRVTARMATPLMAEIVARWIGDGTAAALAEFQRQEVKARRRIAQRALAGIEAVTHPASFHLWVPLPPERPADALTAELTWRGVLVLPAAAFAVARAGMPNAIRVCLGAPRSREATERGLTLLAETIRQPAGAAAVV